MDRPRRFRFAVRLFTSIPVILTTALGLYGQPRRAPFSPPAAVRLAAADLFAKDGTPPAYRPDIAYLWIPEIIPDEFLGVVHGVLSGHVNGMSRRADLVPVYVVPGSGGRLLRISLREYGWDPATFDRFATADIYFYDRVPLTEYWPGGYENGKYYAPGRYTRKVLAVAPYVTEDEATTRAVKDLLAGIQPHHGNGKRTVPIVSLTVFAHRTFQSVNGPPTYNEFLGVKKEADFFKLVGVRQDENEELAKNLLAVFAESGVTKEPRAIEFREKIGGKFFRSHDFLEGKAVGSNNPLNNLGADAKPFTLRARADAHETYGHLPNGLWGLNIADANGNVQNVAPQGVTTGDTTSTDSRDHDVHIPLSCIRCHSEGGLKDLDDWVRNLQQPPPFPPLSLQVGDKKGDPRNIEQSVNEALRFRRQYGKSLIPHITQGRAIYETALREVTGMNSGEYAISYGKLWQLVAETPITSEWAARDFCMTEGDFVGALDRAVKDRGGLPPIMTGFLKPRDKQKPIRLRQYLEAYPQTQRVIRGLEEVKSK